jgi:hypothetical protein
LDDFLTLPSDLNADALDFSPDMVEVWHRRPIKLTGPTVNGSGTKSKPLGLVYSKQARPNRPPEALEPNVRPPMDAGTYLVCFQTRR